MSTIKIINPNEIYDFNKLTLGNPVQTNNNMFFSKISSDNDIYIQTPEITCKEGIVNNSKKPYIDLLFDHSHEKFVEYIENLEQQVKKLIYEKRNEWFQDSNVDINDIDNIFISPFRTFKSGKKLILRVHLEMPKSLIHKNDIDIYDENENELTLESIDINTYFIALLHINGLRFSSKTFQIYIDVKQIMVINNTLINEKVLINNNKQKINKNEIKEPIEEYKQKTNEEPEPIEEDKQKTNEESEPIKEYIEEPIEEPKKEINEESNEESNKEKHEETNNEKNKKEKNIIYHSINDVVQNNNNDTYNINTHEISDIELKDKELLDIKEFDLNLENLENDNIQINKPLREHIEKYKNALLKAKNAQKEALKLHLEAKNIKAQYLLNIDSDTDSD